MRHENMALKSETFASLKQWCSEHLAWVGNVQGPQSKRAPERENKKKPKKKILNKEEKERLKRKIFF